MASIVQNLSPPLGQTHARSSDFKAFPCALPTICPSVHPGSQASLFITPAWRLDSSIILPILKFRQPNQQLRSRTRSFYARQNFQWPPLRPATEFCLCALPVSRASLSIEAAKLDHPSRNLASPIHGPLGVTVSHKTPRRRLLRCAYPGPSHAARGFHPPA